MKEYPTQCGWYQPWMMVMASIRKQTKQAIVSKSVSTTLWSWCPVPPTPAPSSGSFPI